MNQEIVAPSPATVGSLVPESLSQEPPRHEFADFYREFIPKLIRFLLWQGSSLADAADIAQETMRLTHIHWAAIHSPRAWSRLVASREFVKRATQIEDPVGLVPEPGPLVMSIDDAQRWEQQQTVIHLLRTLPPRQRQVMAWTYEGTPTEIATLLRLTPTAVRSTLLKGRRALAYAITAQPEADA